jgi:hypothetical protein
MRKLPILLGIVVLASGPLPLAARQAGSNPVRATGDITPPNILSAEESARGFRLIFDGATTRGWRGFRRATMPEGWSVVNGSLTRTGRGGDIITTDQFGNFELRLQWRIAPGGNSGIFFRVTEDQPWSYHTGPEYQVLDDAAHPDGRSRLTSAGSNFALHAAPQGVVRPAGEWNDTRLVVNGARVEHWLNGVRVVEYELWTTEWEQLVQASKFAQWPSYGRAPRGHIALQDHGDRVEFRTIRIVELP